MGMGSEGWEQWVDHGVGVESEGLGLGSGAAMPSGRVLSVSVCACATSFYPEPAFVNFPELYPPSHS